MRLTLMMMGSFVPSKHVQSVTFEDSGVVIAFTDSNGVRKDGALQLMQNLFIGAHADYRDELADLRDRALEVLEDALEDYTTADVVDLDRDDEGGDDDKGMGE